jgi:hypothetical protein
MNRAPRHWLEGLVLLAAAVAGLPAQGTTLPDEDLNDAAAGAAAGAGPLAEAAALTEGVRVFEPEYYDEFDPISARELVFRTPGFNMDQDDGGRGLAGVRSNILINGMRPPPKGQSVEQQLREIPVDAVERIELIDAGARQDIDMQGYPQVINVVTVADKPAYYEAVTQLHHAGTGDLDQENASNVEFEGTSTLPVGVHELTLRGNYRNQDNQNPGEFVAIDPANPEQRISSVNKWGRDNYGLLVAADLVLPAASTIQVTAGVNSFEQQSAPLVIADSGGFEPVRQRSQNANDNHDLSGEYYRPFGASSNLMFALVDSGFEQENASSLTEAGTVRASLREGEGGESAMRARVTQNLNERLVVRSEATMAFNFFEGGFRLFENGVEIPVAGSENRVEEDRNSVEGSVDWNFSERWTLQGSVGLESYDITSANASSGKQTDPMGSFAVSFRPQPRTTWKLESVRDIGQLSFDEFLASSNLSSEIITAGATALEPERFWEHTASYDRRFGDVGVLQFSLSRRTVDNPVRQVALSDELIVAQNSRPETLDSFNARVEYPFERFGREDLVLAINGYLSDSEAIDPITLEDREISGQTTRQLWLEFRRDPGTSRLAWGATIGRSESAANYAVRSISVDRNSEEWETYVEWEVIDGLKLRANVNGPRWYDASTSFYGAVRQPGLDPSFVATSRYQYDNSASFTVEWRRRDHFEVRASLSTNPEVKSVETLYPYGSVAGTAQATTYAETPRATIRFRYYR